jgi:hypothetical protein
VLLLLPGGREGAAALAWQKKIPSPACSTVEPEESSLRLSCWVRWVSPSAVGFLGVEEALSGQGFGGRMISADFSALSITALIASAWRLVTEEGEPLNGHPFGLSAGLVLRGVQQGQLGSPGVWRTGGELRRGTLSSRTALWIAWVRSCGRSGSRACLLVVWLCWPGSGDRPGA